MDFLKQYILSISAAAIICGIITNLVEKKSTNAAIVKLICGLFISITIIAPWTQIHFSDFSTYLGSLKIDATNAVANGSKIASESTAAIIKERVEAYILDKAASLNLDITVGVELSKDAPQIPYSVIISGSVSPYKKNALQSIITENLGIPEENQVWNYLQ